MLRVVLARAARSARRTTHFDLEFPRAPQREPYWCHKHRRECRPVEDARQVPLRYTLDTLDRIEAFAACARRGRAAGVLHGDAREIDLEGPYDGVVTSPPYPGLIDYHEQHRYAYELLGLDERRERELGAAARGTSRAAIEEYVDGIARVLANARRSLAPRRARCCIVVNDRRDLYPEILGAAGLRLVDRHERHVNRRTGRRAGEYFESILVAIAPTVVRPSRPDARLSGGAAYRAARRLPETGPGRVPSAVVTSTLARPGQTLGSVRSVGRVLARAVTYAVVGLEPRRVEVEAHLVTAGVPAFSIVGLADRACQEAKHRVRSGIVSAQLEWPLNRRITSTSRRPRCARRARASTCRSRSRCSRPRGSSRRSGSLEHAASASSRSTAACGPVRGTLAVAEGARRAGLEHAASARRSRRPRRRSPASSRFPVQHLAEAVAYLRGEIDAPPFDPPTRTGSRSR